MNTNIYSMLHKKYLNPWYIFAETETSRHVIMMHFGNGDAENRPTDLRPLQTVD